MFTKSVCIAAICSMSTVFAQKTVTTTGGTANVVPKYSGSSTIIDSAIFESNGNVGIGTTAPTSPLQVVYDPTATSGIFTSGFIQSTINPSANSSATYTGLKTDTTTKSGNTRSFSGPLFGSLFAVDHYGSGSLASAYGLEGEVSNRSTGTVSNAYALWLQLQNTGKGAITNGYGLRIGAPVNSGGGTVTNFYGIYVEKPSALGSAYSIYSAGGTSYFAGAVGIGTSIPGSPLTVNGVIQSTSGGIKFPDGSTQTKAQVQGPAGPQGQQGVAGPQGVQGRTGPAGPQGPIGPSHAYATSCLSSSCSTVQIGSSPTQLLSLSLPAGSFVLTAKANIEVNTVYSLDVICQLVQESSSTVLDTSEFSSPTPAGGENSPGEKVVLVGSAVLTLQSTDAVSLQCGASSDGGSSPLAFASNTQLNAVLVGGVN